MNYSKNVLELNQNPKNAGSLDSSKKNVGTGMVGAPACGDVIKLQIEVDDNGIITDAKFKTFGCGAAIASSALVTELIKGKHIEKAKEIKNIEVADHLSLPPVKLHCSVMAEEAIEMAIKDYLSKN